VGVKRRKADPPLPPRAPGDNVPLPAFLDLIDHCLKLEERIVVLEEKAGIFK
jgi:hypothetical protein